MEKDPGRPRPSWVDNKSVREHDPNRFRPWVVGSQVDLQDRFGSHNIAINHSLHPYQREPKENLRQKLELEYQDPVTH